MPQRDADDAEIRLHAAVCSFGQAAAAATQRLAAGVEAKVHKIFIRPPIEPREANGDVFERVKLRRQKSIDRQNRTTTRRRR